MNTIKLTVVIITIIMFHACSKCDNKPLNEVRVRIENNLGVDVNSVIMGSTMYKNNNSFASCTLTEEFDEVKSGVTSEYKNTYGNHMGYNGLRIDWYDGIRDALSATTEQGDIFISELLRNGALEDSVANVYNGNMIYGLRLPDGDYTFIMNGFTVAQKPQVDVEIRKDR